MLDENTVYIYRPTGEHFASYTEVSKFLAETETKIQEIQEHLQKTQENLGKTQEEKNLLVQKLKELGINSDDTLIKA